MTDLSCHEDLLLCEPDKEVNDDGGCGWGAALAFQMWIEKCFGRDNTQPALPIFFPFLSLSFFSLSSHACVSTMFSKPNPFDESVGKSRMKRSSK